jgi:hypothetical protein
VFADCKSTDVRELAARELRGDGVKNSGQLHALKFTLVHNVD